MMAFPPRLPAMQRLIIPPHPRLSPLILHLLAMRLDGCENHLPSALSPCLIVFVRGGSALRRNDGRLEPVPRASLCGPYLTARRSQALAGTLFISVMFRPGMLDLAMGFPVSELGDGIVPLESVCGRAATDRLLDEVDSARHIAEAADAVQRFLLARLGEWPRNTPSVRPCCRPATSCSVRFGTSPPTSASASANWSAGCARASACPCATCAA